MKSGHSGRVEEGIRPVNRITGFERRIVLNCNSRRYGRCRYKKGTGRNDEGCDLRVEPGRLLLFFFFLLFQFFHEHAVTVTIHLGTVTVNAGIFGNPGLIEFKCSNG